MRITHLGHVVFYVESLERSLAFYRDLVGMSEIRATDSTFCAAALTSGPTHHELLLIEVGSLPGPTPGPRRGFYHAGFCIGQDIQVLRDARDELIDAGVTIKGASDHGVTQSLYLLDPDGNEIEIYVDDPNVDWRTDPTTIVAPIRPLDL